jgi:hypothetical protein
MDFPKNMRLRYSSKQNLYFPLECLVEFLLLKLLSIVVCEREI